MRIKQAMDLWEPTSGPPLEGDLVHPGCLVANLSLTRNLGRKPFLSVHFLHLFGCEFQFASGFPINLGIFHVLYIYTYVYVYIYIYSISIYICIYIWDNMAIYPLIHAPALDPVGTSQCGQAALGRLRSTVKSVM